MVGCQSQVAGHPSGEAITIERDEAGRVRSTTFSAGQLDVDYDATTAQRVAATAPGGVEMAWSYDGPLLTDTTWSGPVNVTLSHAHDLDFRVVGERIDGGAFVDRFYDADGLLLGSGPLLLERDPTHGAVIGSEAGVVRHAAALNGFGEPMTVAFSADDDEVLRFDDERDRLGRLVGRDETRAGVRRRFDYAYDDAGRLAQVTLDGVVRATYRWDDNGNRTTVERDGVVEESVVDEQDRLLVRGATTYAWDADGALLLRTDTTTGATTRFDYDTLGGLRGVELPDGRTISYVIDAQGRRIGKRIDGTLVQAFVYDGALRIVAELDGTGTVRRRFIYGTRVNVPDVVLDVVTGEAWRLLHDQLGSPRLVIDIDSGAVVAEREWDEFGRVLVDTAPGLLPFGYAGGLEDIDTGLIRFGARDYDADAGRWTTKDPISFAGGTTNLYEYVGNQPVNHIDPTGLFVPGALVVAALGAEAFGIGSISVAAASAGGIATAVGVSLGAAAVGTAVALSVEAGVGGPSGNPFAVPSGIEGESITDDAEMCAGGSGQPPQLPPHEEGPQPRRDCGSELRAALQVVANAPPPVRTSLELAARARYKACIDAGGDP